MVLLLKKQNKTQHRGSNMKSQGLICWASRAGGRRQEQDSLARTRSRVWMLPQLIDWEHYGNGAFPGG